MIKINFINYYNNIIQSINDNNKYLLNLNKGDFIKFDDIEYSVKHKKLIFEEGKCIEINIYVDDDNRKLLKYG
jgi:hypothetical protein